MLQNNNKHYTVGNNFIIARLNTIITYTSRYYHHIYYIIYTLTKAPPGCRRLSQWAITFTWNNIPWNHHHHHHRGAAYISGSSSPIIRLRAATHIIIAFSGPVCNNMGIITDDIREAWLKMCAAVKITAGKFGRRGKIYSGDQCPALLEPAMMRAVGPSAASRPTLEQAANRPVSLASIFLKLCTE